MTNVEDEIHYEILNKKDYEKIKENLYNLSPFILLKPEIYEGLCFDGWTSKLEPWLNLSYSDTARICKNKRTKRNSNLQFPQLVKNHFNFNNYSASSINNSFVGKSKVNYFRNFDDCDSHLIYYKHIKGYDALLPETKNQEDSESPVTPSNNENITKKRSVSSKPKSGKTEKSISKEQETPPKPKSSNRNDLISANDIIDEKEISELFKHILNSKDKSDPERKKVVIDCSVNPMSSNSADRQHKPLFPAKKSKLPIFNYNNQDDKNSNYFWGYDSSANKKITLDSSLVINGLKTITNDSAFNDDHPKSPVRSNTNIYGSLLSYFKQGSWPVPQRSITNIDFQMYLRNQTNGFRLKSTQLPLRSIPSLKGIPLRKSFKNVNTSKSIDISDFMNNNNIN